MPTKSRAGQVRIKCHGPGCGKTFHARTSRAKFCSSTCRNRARRRGEVGPEHDLVKAVKADLRKGDALGSYVGQSAVRIAEQLATSGTATLSKELDRLMTLALGKPAAPAPAEGPGESTEPDDEISRAIKAREAKAAAMGS